MDELDLQDSLLEAERIKNAEAAIDESILADIDAVYALTHPFPDVAREARERFAEQTKVLAWIDVSCDERFHYFQRTDKGLEVFHADNQPCTLSEYSLPFKDRE
jgi:hypothetical protein